MRQEGELEKHFFCVYWTHSFSLWHAEKTLSDSPEQLKQWRYDFCSYLLLFWCFLLKKIILKKLFPLFFDHIFDSSFPQ